MRDRARWTGRAVTLGCFVLPIAFGTVFFALPFGSILTTGLRPGGRWDLTALGDVVTDDAVRRVAWFTLWQAALSTVATVIAALPAAWLLGRVSFRGRSVFSALLVVPFVLPTVVVGTAFLALVGPDGPVERIGGALGADWDLRHTTGVVLAAHVFFNLAVVARTVGTAWMGIDRRSEEVARTLGAGRLRAFVEVVWPRLRPAVASSGAIVFLFTFTSFGVVKILGGPRLATLEVEIHRVTTQLLDLPTAAALSLVQLAAVVAALAAHRRVGRAAPADRAAAGDTALRSVRGRARLAVAAVVAGTTAILVAPMATLAWRSFDTAHGFGLDHYRALGTVRRGTTAFVPPLDAVRNSLVFGAAAAVIATVVGTGAAVGLHRLSASAGKRRRGSWRGALDGVLMLPLGASAVTVGFGFLIALDDPPLDLRSSPLLIPAAQAVVATPFVIRTVLPAIDAVPDRLRHAAAVLGASPVRRWWGVDAALIRRSVLVAAGFSFAISLGEFGATVFIARADRPTVPVAIFRALSQPGAVSIGMAMALSTILMVMTAIVMLIVDRIGDARIGGF